jgi:hypothetical protein
MILIPLAITVFCLWQMLKPWQPASEALAFLPVLFKLLWLIPIGFSWAFYFAFACMFAMSGKGFWF